MECDQILGQDKEKEITILSEWFTEQIKPKKLQGFGNFEAEYDKAFDETCFLLGKHVGTSPRHIKELSVREFYSAISYLKNNMPKK